jgi:hypothetical protein
MVSPEILTASLAIKKELVAAMNKSTFHRHVKLLLF